MKVISPECELIDSYFQHNQIEEQIERCGRVCYKSEAKIAPGSANSFIKAIISRGHESVLEMAQIHLELKLSSDTPLQRFLENIPRFFTVDRVDPEDKGCILLSANPRAFRDAARAFPSLKLVKAVMRVLTEHFPRLFEDLAPKHGWPQQDGVTVRLVPVQDMEGMTPLVFRRHRTVLFNIITNRAVTHELVRHRIASYLQESQRYCRYSEDKFGSEVTFVEPCFYEKGSPEYQIWQEAMELTEAKYLELLKTSSPQAARNVLPNSCKTEIMVHATIEEWQHIIRLRTSAAADPAMQQTMRLVLGQLQTAFPQFFPKNSAA